MKIKVWKSKDGWRVSLVFANGRIFATSEAYSRFGKAMRAAIQVYKIGARADIGHPNFEVEGLSDSQVEKLYDPSFD